MSRGPILIVEDDDVIRERLAEILAMRGYAVETAENGLVALEKLEAAALKPCLIVLDLLMPVMDGATFRREMLTRPHVSDVPVVILSGIAHRDVTARELGAVGVLRKPLDLARLYQLIGQHC